MSGTVSTGTRRTAPVRADSLLGAEAAAAPSERHWLTSVSWALEGAMLLAAVIFARIGNTSTLVYAVVLFGLLVIARQVSVRSVAHRQVLASAAMFTMFIAIPVNRLPSSGTLIVTMALVAIAIATSGIVGSRMRLPSGAVILVVLILALTFVTVVSPDTAPLLRELPFIASSLPILILAGQSGPLARIRIARFVVFAGVVESLLALVEPRLFPGHLWVTAQLNAAGAKVALLNPLLGNTLERSQGTLGHPLALGFLLLIAIALTVCTFPTLRMTAKVLLVTVLLAGLLMSGSRNSLIIAAVILLYFLPGRLTLVRVIVSTLVGLFVLGLAIGGSWLSQSAQRDFSDSGSVVHRLGAYDTIGKLLADQSVLHALFGNGYASTSRLFQLGLLQTDGFDVIDNQFIFSLAIGGILSAVLLATLAILAFLKSSLAFKPAVVAVVGTMFIFDTYGSPAVTVVSFAVLGFALNPKSEVSIIWGPASERRASN